MVMLLSCGTLSSQVSYGEVAKRLDLQISKAQTDTARARLMGLLAWELKFQDPARAITLADQALAIGKKRNDYLIMADAYRVKALTQVIEEQVSAGLANYDSCLVCANKIQRLDYVASCYSLMAGMYGDYGDYDKAIELYAKGLSVAQKLGEPLWIATLANNLAEVYQSQGMNTKLVQANFELALENSIKMQSWARAAMNSANLAKEYYLRKDVAQAQEELKRTIELFNKDLSNAYQVGTTSHVLSDIYFGLADYVSAERYALSSLHIMDSLKRRDNALRPLSVLTQVYIQQGRLDKAAAYAQRLLRDAKTQQAKIYIRDGYKALSDIARANNKALQALEYYEQYKSWNDSVFNAEREKRISDMELQAELAQKELLVKYETDKKNTENAFLHEQNRGLRRRMLISVAAIILFLGLGTALFRSNRLKQKINAALKQEKELVEQQAIEKTMLVHEIHHRVKNNLTMLKSLLYLQARSSKQDETKRILQESQARIQSMALIHQSLYDQNEKGQLDFVQFTKQLLTELCSGYRMQEADVQFKVSGQCRDLQLQQAIPLGLIINELATNSLKYAFKDLDNGLISVHVSERPGFLTIQYTDNGPGLPEVFDLSQGGFGFKVMQILSQQLGAEISYEKKPGASNFRVELPIEAWTG